MLGWLGPRAWLRSLVRLWRRSLSLRTIVITVSLSAVAALTVGIAIDVSVGQSLFDARRTQLVALSQNATIDAQRVFDSTAGLTEFEPDEVLDTAARAILSAAATTSSATQYALRLGEGQSSSVFNVESNSTGLDVDAVVSDELRETLADSTEHRVYSQSVGLNTDQGVVPGLVTGSTLDVQGVRYELYLVYDISDTQATLDVVALALAIAGVVLLAFIGAIAWLVVRLVVGPVEVAAATSRRLADGELDVRIPVRGEDVVAMLATSFNEMAESLKGQITRLAELSSLQQRFVSDVSHELRTPLTTIRMAGDLLRERADGFDADTARTVELLHTQVLRFEELLADLIELSRIDAGAVEMELDQVNLGRLAADTVQAMTPLAERRGSELVLVAAGGFIPAEVDARRIRRILTNLIGNAVDHGEGRPIEVWVDSDEHAVAIAVRDHGVGIAPEHLDRVFDRFWRADPSRQRMTGGSGLGLAISLEDALLHGGTLDAWSEPGRGACFRLTLPLNHGAPVEGSPLPLPPEDTEDGGEPPNPVAADSGGGAR